MSRQVDKKYRKDVPIDAELHKLVRIKSAKLGVTIKSLVEGYIAEGLRDETIQN